MTIEEFHNSYWSGKSFWLNDHMYYHQQASEKSRYWDEKEKGNFDPHFSMNNFSRKLGKFFTPQEIEKNYDSIDWDKYAGKKFVLGDYTFYGFASEIYKCNFHKKTYYAHAIYMDYHGYRLKALDLQRGISFKEEKYSSYSKSIEGIEELMQLLKDNPNIPLLDYEIKELTGPIGLEKVDSSIGMTPFGMLEKKHPTYKWKGAGEKIGKIDLDHFVKMETKDGVYQPSSSIISKLINNFDREPIVKSTTKKLKDLGITKVQLRNNAHYNIAKYYDLEGIEVKASKSVLSMYEKMREYSNDEKAKKEIEAENKAAKEAYEKSVYDDTYTLMHHGKIVLQNIRSYDIVNYFENKEYKDFEVSVVEAGKKCFEIDAELTKIFFGRYGIYSYTEMSGESFADFENIESINKAKDIKLSKRLTTLIETGAIELPYMDEDDKLFSFEKGATYIGVTKDKNGAVHMIQEDGDQGI